MTKKYNLGQLRGAYGAGHYDAIKSLPFCSCSGRKKLIDAQYFVFVEDEENKENQGWLRGVIVECEDGPDYFNFVIEDKCPLCGKPLPPYEDYRLE